MGASGEKTAECPRILEIMGEEQKHKEYNRNIMFGNISTASAVSKTLSVLIARSGLIAQGGQWRSRGDPGMTI